MSSNQCALLDADWPITSTSQPFRLKTIQSGKGGGALGFLSSGLAGEMMG